MYIDRDFKDLQQNVVFQKTFKSFPQMHVINGQMICSSETPSVLEVTDSQTETFKNRLHLARARVFSHPKKFQKAKLVTVNSNLHTEGQITVHHVHSVVGAS